MSGTVQACVQTWTWAQTAALALLVAFFVFIVWVADRNAR